MTIEQKTPKTILKLDIATSRVKNHMKAAAEPGVPQILKQIEAETDEERKGSLQKALKSGRIRFSGDSRAFVAAIAEYVARRPIEAAMDRGITTFTPKVLVEDDDGLPLAHICAAWALAKVQTPEMQASDTEPEPDEEQAEDDKTESSEGSEPEEELEAAEEVPPEAPKKKNKSRGDFQTYVEKLFKSAKNGRDIKARMRPDAKALLNALIQDVVASMTRTACELIVAQGTRTVTVDILEQAMTILFSAPDDYTLCLEEDSEGKFSLVRKWKDDCMRSRMMEYVSDVGIVKKVAVPRKKVAKTAEVSAESD